MEAATHLVSSIAVVWLSSWNALEESNCKYFKANKTMGLFSVSIADQAAISAKSTNTENVCFDGSEDADLVHRLFLSALL